MKMLSILFLSIALCSCNYVSEKDKEDYVMELRSHASSARVIETNNLNLLEELKAPYWRFAISNLYR